MKNAANWYKKYLGWFWKHKIITAIIVLVVIIVAATSGSSNNQNTSDNQTAAKSSTQSQQKTSTNTQPAKPAERQVKGTAVTLGAGTFTGGKDVAVGLYDVTPGAGQSGNFIVSGTDSYNEILGNAGAAGGVPKVRVQISDGDKVEISSLSSVTFTPVTAPFVTAHKTVNLYAGTFIVGQDIGAGRYEATPGAGQSGNFIVSGADSYNEILGGDTAYGGVPKVSVTLSNGDVIAVSSLSQVTMTAQ